jgi:hypothetical protein
MGIAVPVFLPECGKGKGKGKGKAYIINQRDVTFLISLFILYMFRTVLFHYQEFCFVMYAGLTL